MLLVVQLTGQSITSRWQRGIITKRDEKNAECTELFFHSCSCEWERLFYIQQSKRGEREKERGSAAARSALWNDIVRLASTRADVYNSAASPRATNSVSRRARSESDAQPPEVSTGFSCVASVIFHLLLIWTRWIWRKSVRQHVRQNSADNRTSKWCRFALWLQSSPTFDGWDNSSR